MIETIVDIMMIEKTKAINLVSFPFLRKKIIPPTNNNPRIKTSQTSKVLLPGPMYKYKGFIFQNIPLKNSLDARKSGEVLVR